METPKSSSILRKISNILKPIQCVRFTKAVSIAWNDLPRWGSAQPQRSKICGSVSGRDDGSKHIRAKQKFIACKSSWNPRGNQKSFLCQFLGIRQRLWRSLLESLHVYTPQIGNKWDCWESSTQSERRNFSSIVAIGCKWKLVGRLYGMLHLSAKCYRSLVWWEDSIRKTSWATI